MKNKFLLITSFICLISVLSCKFENPDAECGNDNQVSENYYVNFINNSSYSVSVYLSNSRTPENFFVEIPANSQEKKELIFLGEETRTFYFVCNLNFGIKDFSFPYYDDDSFKLVSVNKNEINNCKIDENPISKKNLSFIFLKNSTNSAIYLKNGSEPLFPYNSEVKFVTCEDIGGYVIDDEDNSENLSLPLGDIKIHVGGGNIFADFPSFDYKLGFIYHITCIPEGAKLTSINHLDKSEHNFSYQIDDEFHFESCSICEFETEPENHKFSLLQVDDINHWYTCICGLEDENSKLEHQYTSYYDENYHWNVCECGLGKEKIEHKFTVIYDNQFHWSTCLCGFTSKKSQHTLGNWQKIDGEDIKKCSLCDFTVTADENTHVIYSVSDLQNIKNNNTSSAIFELANDIDGGGQLWTPIDTFYGTLVGNGFSIKNFMINQESSLDNEIAYCGFFYKNRGTIKNIFFKNITVDAYFEYFTSDWRKVNVGTVTGINSGTIKNVHMENIQISSVLNHQKNQDKTPHQLNIVGGIAGISKGIISYCSVKNSEISASTSAKKNRCDTSSYAGGICGDVQNVIDNVLVVTTSVATHSEGGFMDGWFTGDDLDDGILKSYAGNVFGTVNSNNVSKVVSYNSDAIATTYDISYNPTSYKNSDKIAGINKEKITSKYSLQASDLNSYSSTINSWDGWSVDVTNNNIENYLDFN